MKTEIKIEKNEVIESIAATQDGGNLNSSDEYSQFIRSRIDANTDENGYTEVDELLSDLNYMINQLQRAKKPLEKIVDEY